jgi:hypothetical protein
VTNLAVLTNALTADEREMIGYCEFLLAKARQAGLGVCELPVVPVVLNISFNESEPMICRTLEVIDCFF